MTINELQKNLNGKHGNEYRSLSVYVVRKNIKEKLEPQYTTFAIEGNEMDEYFVSNVAFRAANILLKGTEFEKLPWVEYDDVKTSRGDFAYIKKIDNSNYAYWHLDYFYHT